MFTLQQIRAAHAKVKSGIDFPAYVHEIKQLGLVHYDFLVKNGQTEYHGANGLQVNGEARYPEKIISIQSSSIAVRQIIAEHQQGKSDFLTFCQLVAGAGVNKWVVDTQAMICTYYDLAGNSLVAEPIPESGY
ncbi:DUF1398 family protein [Mucilaginibacter sp. HC2]|uniref:DUF1398 domain-containing protein n=1 Tax=Mucilaginibacter TaxID=423349 RepID=UPI000DCC1F8D|nr:MULTISPECIES: DUF1398 family protein [Mucilaginibacter]NHA05511.1 DUF1398 family protein [Mucilaginibacter inviolabilis]QTE35319.1 DUF1398 family protein [Mucilaginibacter gossypii]RAV59527.1 phage envelope protein [Mucilaginibacter rubeus]